MKPSQFIYKLSILLTGLIFFMVSGANATTFYSKGDLAANTRTNWTTSSTGSGGSSPTTTQWGQSTHTYIIRNGDAMTTTAAWSLASSLQIVAGGSLTVGTTNSYSLMIGGTMDISGTLTVRNTSTKNFTGNVTVNTGGIFTISGNQTVNFSNNLTVSSGGTLNQNNNYDNATVLMEVDGNLSINGTYNYSGYLPAIWMNGTGTHYINTGTTSLCKLFLRQGNFYANGTVTIDQDFYAMWNQVGGSFHTNGQTVNANWGVANSGGTFYVDGGTLTVGNTVGGMLIGRTATLDGDLEVSLGTINISGGGIYLGTPSSSTPKGTCTQSGGTINIAVLDLGQNCTFTQSGGINNVNGSLNLNYSSSTYNQTGSSALSIAGNFTNNGVYTAGAGTPAINIDGNWYNNLTFTTSSTNTVTFNGGGIQSLGGSASTTFNNLTINNPTSVNIAKDAIVNSTLTLTNGKLTLGTNNLILASGAATIAGAPFSASNMIAADGGGEVRKNYSATGSYFFPVGDVTGTAEYSPISLNYTSGTFVGGAYTGVKVINTKHPNNASSTDYLKRYWTISNSGITSPSFTATANYVAADIAGTESNIFGAKYTGSLPWVKYSVISSNTLTTTSLNNTGAGIVITGITKQLPTVSIPAAGYCAGGSVGLSPSIINATNSMTYLWSPSTGLSSTTVENPTATPTSPTTYTLNITDGNGFTNSANVTVTQNPTGSWSGAGSSSNWNDPSNWVCGPIPTSTIDVTIPAGLSFYPIVSSGTGYARNITVQSGASLTISGGALQISGTITSAGDFDVSNGTLEMSGTSAQTIDGSEFTSKTIKNLIVSNTGSGLSISSAANDTLKITGTLSFGNSSSTLNTGDNLTLVSDSLGTANLDKVGSGNTINGKAIVERYINIGTIGGRHAKSWQFLSAPVNGQSIKQSWMEDSINTNNNYGTTITSPFGKTAGFDLYSVAPSVKYYVDSTNSWAGIPNTDTSVNSPNGYLIFVRGDRTVTTSSEPANATTLRAKGTFSVGTLPAINIKLDHFQSIGNPYASPVDFTLLTKSATVDTLFYVWDPYLYGTYGVGGYQVLSSVNGWKPVPGGTLAYPSGVGDSIIQSGQAFFVHATSPPSGPAMRTYDATPGAALTFTEDAKVGGGGTVNFARKAQRVSSIQLQALSASLFTGPNQSDLMADGNTVVFGQNYSDKVDGKDALKIANSGENFGLKTAGKSLSIDARAPLTVADTLNYNMSNLAKRTYQLRFAPVNLQSTGLQAFLIDGFLKTETPVSLSDSSFVDVAITSNAASAAANRFMVVFRQMGVLPVTITSLSASHKNQDNVIQWSVQNEKGIQQYEVEKSTDGNHFSQLEVVSPLNNGVGNYNSTDTDVPTGTLYYRIESISLDGKITYSQVATVTNGQLTTGISVFPNPVKDDIINLHINNQSAGIYKYKLYNSAGQLMNFGNFNHAAGTSKESISCGSFPKGIYQLEISKPDGTADVIKVIK